MGELLNDETVRQHPAAHDPGCKSVSDERAYCLSLFEGVHIEYLSRVGIQQFIGVGSESFGLLSFANGNVYLINQIFSNDSLGAHTLSIHLILFLSNYEVRQEAKL
jgi:hypothetical protein